MEEKNNVEKSKKKLGIYYGLLVTVICIIGVSFAWFRLYLSQSEDNTLASRTCFNTTLTEDTSKIELTDAFPISDEDGLKQTPFTFTLKNNCDSYVKVYITIDSTYRESTSSSYLKDSYMKVNVSPKDTTSGASKVLGNQTLTDLENNRKGYILSTAYLNANEEKSFDLRIWMDSETTLDQGLNKNWAGKIVVVSNASSVPTFAETILTNNEVKTPLTTLGSEISAYTKDDISVIRNAVIFSTSDKDYYITYGTGYVANGTKFDLTGTAVTSDTYANSYSSLVGKYLASSIFSYEIGSKTAGVMRKTTDLSSVFYVVSASEDGFTYKEITSNKNISEALLASTEDDYGTSYYFRGAVKNNYVQFANKCWRIVRIVGDGSVKLVLHNDNTSGATKPCAVANNDKAAAFARYSGTTYTSVFNDNNDDNAYVGFMYGATGASDYASTHANTNKSTIFTNLETWYKKNLTAYEDNLTDIMWCSDKSVVTNTSFDPKEIRSNGLGYGKNATYYGSATRLVNENDSSSNHIAGGTGPSLKCNDGLSKISSKIGLLNADEVIFAGAIVYFGNHSMYLYENASSTSWWTMSPYYFNGNYAYDWLVSYGYVDGGITDNSSAAVRPAISLMSSTMISGGTGTSEDPYVVN